MKQYTFENVNPNTVFHYLLYCARCDACMGLTKELIDCEKICYKCYRELLNKN